MNIQSIGGLLLSGGCNYLMNKQIIPVANLDNLTVLNKIEAYTPERAGITVLDFFFRD